jgi:ferritin-like metal-binding protein YciE
MLLQVVQTAVRAYDLRSQINLHNNETNAKIGQLHQLMEEGIQNVEASKPAHQIYINYNCNHGKN